MSKDSRKEAQKMRRQIKEDIAKGVMYPGYNPEDEDKLEEWMDLLNKKLGEASADCIEQFYSKKGFAEAYLIGLARFTATMLERMQAEGMVTEGKQIWDAYYLAILPTAHEIVVSKAKLTKGKPMMNDEQFAREIYEALTDESLTIEQVYDKFFSLKSKKDREGCIRALTKVREKIKNGDFDKEE